MVGVATSEDNRTSTLSGGELGLARECQALLSPAAVPSRGGEVGLARECQALLCPAVVPSSGGEVGLARECQALLCPAAVPSSGGEVGLARERQALLCPAAGVAEEVCRRCGRAAQPREKAGPCRVLLTALALLLSHVIITYNNNTHNTSAKAKVEE
ncbi:hypothetical protein DUI87_28109 [Hirundo rustica rustica]|uniref:Uncharacterized protein n=1 Tax=Hirundo rustica rustica TaxID=333673 RepID=A0A3M0J996_HIRRU|nr:hypothetical protein DUI87_28109 [Hirundo rustica rustica]